MTDLVILPGMDGFGSLSAEFVAAMRPSANPIVVTYPHARPWGYAELETFVYRQLPTDRPFVLLAESFSGPIAISIAARRPIGLAALVLVCTFVRLPIAIPKWIARLISHAPIESLSIALGARFALGRFSTKRTRIELQRTASALSTTTLRRRLQSIIGVDVASQMGQINVPVLYLRARNDRVVSRASSDEILRLCPGASVSEIDGPHFLLFCKPAECAEAVRAFISASSLRI